VKVCQCQWIQLEMCGKLNICSTDTRRRTYTNTRH